MEIFRFSILPMAEVERREAFKEAVNKCPICGSRLSFEYRTDFLKNSIHEEAQCEKCAVKIREEEHEVQ